MELSGILIQAIKMAPRSEWEKFFDAEITQQALRITGVSAAELPALQETVKGMQALRNKFLDGYDTKIKLQ